MKKILLAISIFNLLLLSFTLLAHFNHFFVIDPPAPGPADPGANDPDAVPINQCEWMLAVIGLAYVFYKGRAAILNKG